ncbi:MAG: carbamoyl phosphate synthase large subunit [Candidatus Omnitrophica bacterium 4484_70.2]|nr:MAG: carbamoyl phosphate synthase large subunit [Candidatus Omnitrophica bacterium 4484_70.2]
MPKRKDIEKILIIGSGPIVISQACEFDYSGTQACKSLKSEGFKIVLLNSNPATIMTDPEFADATYIEPITADVLEKIIEREKPDAVLPTLGGQTALNVAFEAWKRGIFDKYKVKMIGANAQAIQRAEDREFFKKTMKEAGLQVPRSCTVSSLKEAREALKEIGLPCVIRPAFTLGGTGGGIAFNKEEFEEICIQGLNQSLIHQVLIEESVYGWKEFELEVMRDGKDNVVIICSIENFDPMGIHTGDSITVAPVQTLTDKEYQKMREWAIRAIRAIGVETGGSNVQFAVNPYDGRMVIIEINPRVSRSSALASKATGFPIAKIAAKLAVGYTLDEIPNDITKETPASFEPTIDYCVVKMPRFTFEKFSGANKILTTSMKSVGETMAIGRTFKEAFQKAIRGLEIGKKGLESLFFKKPEDLLQPQVSQELREEIKFHLKNPSAERIFYIGDALRVGFSVEEVSSFTKIDRWFIDNIKQIIDLEKEVIKSKSNISKALLTKAKEWGFSDEYIGYLLGVKEEKIRSLRSKYNIKACFKLVDTCAAEFEAYTPYFYSTYEKEDESRVTDARKVVILGGGPNRIGQGIEFDYCCVHASFALKEEGIESIMVNSNPETVSTDYDTSTRLYFEPITLEDVLNIIDKEKPLGVILQFGGQTPLNLALGLKKAGVNILGTSAESIDIAEDREKFSNLLKRLNLRQPESGIARSLEEALKVLERLGFPVLVRPSYVLGGRAMEIIYDLKTFEDFVREALIASPYQSILIDKFLEDAIEVDVDLIGDGENFVIGGVMEHIEEAGIHSGDSAMCLPPYSLTEEQITKIKEATYKLACALKIKGLMNVQYAIKDDNLFVLEVNPRASRTIPFVSKAIGVPLAKLATKVMLGRTLKELGFTKEVEIPYFSIKESVFPFNRFPGVDIILGPEMKSTGEVMGIDFDFGKAFMKSQLAASQNLPRKGCVFISVKNKDKRAIVFVAKKLQDLGFEIISTEGTGKVLNRYGVKAKIIPKIQEGRPNILDYIKDRKVHLIINTPSGRIPRQDEVRIRSEAIMHNIPCITTISGAQASVNGIESLLREDLKVVCIQEYHSLIKK